MGHKGTAAEQSKERCELVASKEYWEQIEASNDVQMWLKVISHENEDVEETHQQADKIFSGISGDRCLEIGAGVGRLLKEAASRFSCSFGIDYSAALTMRSVKFLENFPSCKIVLGDGLHFPFASDCFDFVYSFTCFQHMPTLEIIRANIAESYRVLKPKGFFRVQTVEGSPDPGLYDGHVFPSPDVFLHEFERVGFIKESAVSENAWIWVTVRK